MTGSTDDWSFCILDCYSEIFHGIFHFSAPDPGTRYPAKFAKSQAPKPRTGLIGNLGIQFGSSGWRITSILHFRGSFFECHFHFNRSDERKIRLSIKSDQTLPTALKIREHPDPLTRGRYVLCMGPDCM